MQIAGMAALVTGGSRGLGAALAQALARQGARVVVAARGRQALDAVVAGIRAEGGEAHALVADLGSQEAVHPLAAAAAALVGPIDLLVNNASVLGPLPLRLLLDTECEDFGAVLEANLLGPFRLTKLVAGAMALRGRGLVVQVTSDAAVVPYPGWGAYGASKAALEQMSRIWAAELAGTGVRFLSVDPGEMRTRMHADAMPEADPSTLADPSLVAERLLEIVASAEALESGQRVEAAAFAAVRP
jgi:NAD(P)-dependent dehydrogenase (short-subunit alcohol dehydrogenase family)